MQGHRDIIVGGAPARQRGTDGLGKVDPKDSIARVVGEQRLRFERPARASSSPLSTLCGEGARA
jgi:hypothetical protein